MSEFAARYSRVDRFVHDLAMKNLDMQKAMASLEDRIAAARIGGIAFERPVFVTSLPRAGTTLVLEVICADRSFVSHTYRNMPFLLAPLLWDRLSKAFRMRGEARERAHGDGMTVDYDSVEAFEEVIWRAFWPDQYLKDRIRPWRADEPEQDGDFPAFLAAHARKLIALSRARGDAGERYVSKNNASVSRLGYLLGAFPDATVLAPFREPTAHAGSMLRQHVNFLREHAADAFARRYMESIGHLEFGEALRPIDFGGWLDRCAGLSPTGADFWLEYWIVAFETVLAVEDPRLVLFSYDRLCADAGPGLSVIADRIAADPASALRAQAGRFRAPTRYQEAKLDADPERLERARAVHRRLLDRSVL